MIGTRRTIHDDHNGGNYNVVAVYDNTSSCERCLFKETGGSKFYHLCPQKNADCDKLKFVWIEINVDK